MTPEAALHDILQLLMFLTSLLANIWLARGWSKTIERRDSFERSLKMTTRENLSLVQTNDELRARLRRRRKETGKQIGRAISREIHRRKR